MERIVAIIGPSLDLPDLVALDHGVVFPDLLSTMLFVIIGALMFITVAVD